jgi:hypothetical protein
MFPDAITREAAKAAMNIFIPGNLSGRQIIAATITEMKVIRKLIGRISFTMAVSFSVKTIKAIVKDLSKLTKRINI